MYRRFKWNPEIRYDPTVFTTLPSKPSRVFVGSTIDLFHPLVSMWNEGIISLCRRTPEHTFMFLTKQPQNLAKFSPFPENVWLGVSATDGPSFHKNIVPFLNKRNYIREVEAPIRFISFEPLLGSVKYDEWDSILSKDMVDWVIIGAQSRPTIMPKIEWVQEIVEAADKAGIPVFLKDSLGALLPRPISIRFGSLDEGLRQEMPKCQQETPQ